MQRDFKGIWIPKALWLFKDLNLTEKVMLIEIDSLDNEDGCFATNDYFANFFNLSKGRVSKIINNLVKRGYLTSEIKYKEGTRIVEKRTLRVSRWYKSENNSPSISKRLECVAKRDYTSSQERLQPMDENDQYNKLKNKLNSLSQIFEDERIEEKSISEISDEGVRQKKIFNANSDPYLLAKLLENEILKNNPKFPESEKQKQSWAKDFDLMIRRDNISADDIAEIIMWCQQDAFWRSNILSGKKLREKYQQLRMKMNNRM